MSYLPRTLPGPKTKTDKILAKFEECLMDGESRWSDIHNDCRKDKRFIQFGLQLVNEDGTEQNLKGRPRMIINKLIQFVKDVSNDERKTDIAGRVFPLSNGASKSKALARQGVVRGIERTSNAKYAYHYAGEEAITGGMGAFRVDLEHVSDKSFDQNIVINRVLDATTIMYGPCIQPDYSDADWCIVKQKSKAAKQYTSEYYSLLDNSTNRGVWGTFHEPYDYEFWLLDKKPDKLWRLKGINGQPGRNVFKSQMKKDAPEEIFEQRDGKRYERDTERKQWIHYRLKAKEILSTEKWPGRWCPIVVVNGREVINENERRLLSLCRYTKDSQRLYNFARQEMARRMGFSPKAIWKAVIGAIPAKFRQMWDDAHKKSYGTMYWNNRDTAGREIPEPSLIETPAVDPNLAIEVATTDKELKDTTGIQAENLAMKSNATSGRAILAKQNEGDTNTFDFVDNLAIGVQHGNRIVVDLIPKVIDTVRQVRYVGEDDKEKVIEANAEYKNKRTGEVVTDYYFSVEEEYDVGISIGPAFEGKRQEDAENLMNLMKVSEQAAQVLPYMYVANLNFPQAQEASKMLKKLLPPGIAEPDDDDENAQAPIPPEVQQKLQQAQELEVQARAMMKELEELKSAKDVEFAKINQQMKADQAKNNIEQKKVDISMFEAVTDRAELKLKSDEAQDKVDIENKKLNAQVKTEATAAKQAVETDFQSRIDEVIKKFDTQLSEAKAAVSKTEPLQAPTFNITNVMPKPGAKTVKEIPGGYEIKTEDAD